MSKFTVYSLPSVKCCRALALLPYLGSAPDKHYIKRQTISNIALLVVY